MDGEGNSVTVTFGNDNTSDTISGTVDADTIYGGLDTDGLLTGDDDLRGLGGADLLYGGDGNDTLSGGTGNDSLYGGAGSDTLDYSYASGGVSVDLDSNIAVVDSQDTDFVAGAEIEAVIGTPFDDVLHGPIVTSNTKVYYGGDGNDQFNGVSAGIQTLYGGNGDDVLLNPIDRDVLYGDSGSDTIDLHGLFGGIIGIAADLQTGILVNTGGDTFTLVSVESYVGPGSQNNDTVSGSADANLLNGRGGDDTLDGRAGDDSLVGAAGNDILTGGADDDIVLGGDGNDVLSGDAGDDVMLGSSQTTTSTPTDGNALDGGAGNDFMVGATGNDILQGGSAADRILGELGVRPASVSKYCVAVAALHPELPSNPWHQTLRRYFGPLPAAA